MQCTKAKQVIFIGVHSVRLLLPWLDPLSMLLMLVALDQSSSVVVQRYCISLLLCGEFLLGMLACRLGLSSKSSPTIGSFPPTDK